MRFSAGFSGIAALAALALPTSALNYNVSLNSQIHMAYAGSTGMMISWNTYNQLANPTVLYGLSANTLNLSASSNVSVTYNTSLTYNNHVKLSGLQPNTKYYYMPQNTLASNLTKGPFSFTTSRVAGDMTPYSVAIVVDMGTMGPEGLATTGGNITENQNLLPGETNTMQSLQANLDSFDFLLHPGDIAYADAWYKEVQANYINATLATGYLAYESILDEYYDEMTPITTVKPYMVSNGNHEANCNNDMTLQIQNGITCMPGQTNFTGYRNHYRMPSSESGGVESFWYSYDHGMVHYVSINAETDLGGNLSSPSLSSGPFGAPNQQVNWLANDLANVNRTLTPWVVVLGHRPWYSSGDSTPNVGSAFEGILNKYGVDLYFCGHFHVYERNAPLGLGGVPDPKGLNNPSAPWYIINGIAGHWDGFDEFTYPLEPYQVYGIDVNNGTEAWSKLTFHNCSYMTHDLIASNNGSVIDSATLYKSHNNCLAKAITANSTTTGSASSTTSGQAKVTNAGAKVSGFSSVIASLIVVTFATFML